MLGKWPKCRHLVVQSMGFTPRAGTFFAPSLAEPFSTSSASAIVVLVVVIVILLVCLIWKTKLNKTHGGCPFSLQPFLHHHRGHDPDRRRPSTHPL